jgi:hypothetical protein
MNGEEGRGVQKVLQLGTVLDVSTLSEEAPDQLGEETVENAYPVPSRS